MLDSRYFENILTEQSEGFIYEGYRPKDSPLVLFSLVDGSPLASITFKSQNGKAKTLITKRPKSSDFKCDYQGIIGEDNQEFELVITNLTTEGYLNFNILKQDETVHEVNPKGLNEINELKPNESYAVRCDQEDNRSLIFKAITKTKTDQDRSIQVPITLKEDESSGKPTGTYYFLSVVPQFSKPDLVKKFTETAWACVDVFYKKVERKPKTSAWRNPFAYESADTLSYEEEEYDMGDDYPHMMCPRGPPGPQGVSPFQYQSPPMPTIPVSPWRTGGNFFEAGPRGIRGDSGPQGSRGVPAMNMCLGVPGINTVGQSLRSANRQLRGERSEASERLQRLDSNRLNPPVPKVPVCPWKNSTPIKEDEVMSSTAGQVVGGKHVQVRGVETGLEYSYATQSAPCVLGLAINKDLQFGEEPSKETFIEILKEQIEDSIKNQSKELLEKLAKIYTEDLCCICRDEQPNLVFYQCGHQCCHNDCAQGIRDNKCPLCRNCIIARLIV